MGVVVSMASWSRYKPTPHASRCWIVSSRSLRDASAAAFSQCRSGFDPRLLWQPLFLRRKDFLRANLFDEVLTLYVGQMSTFFIVG